MQNFNNNNYGNPYGYNNFYQQPKTNQFYKYERNENCKYLIL